MPKSRNRRKPKVRYQTIDSHYEGKGKNKVKMPNIRRIRIPAAIAKDGTVIREETIYDKSVVKLITHRL